MYQYDQIPRRTCVNRLFSIGLGDGNSICYTVGIKLYYFDNDRFPDLRQIARL